MPPTLNEFIRSLADSGLMADDEVRAFLGGIPASRRPVDASELAEELFRQKKLTKYQAQALYHGRGRGLVLGKYVILDRLGQGGMGQVFKAQHCRMQRTVAIKVLPPELVRSPESVKRFQREVQAAARLSHPNIVTAYDADEAAGIHFLVMECVDGEHLGELVRIHGAFPLQKGLACVLQAARGLEYAHSQGIIHRDIKPSNLLLDKQGVLKILDMGLARIEARMQSGQRPADDEESGRVLGSVDYMSPEQSHDMRATDHRTDIYSLGGTLFFLLTGRPMYPGQSIEQRVQAHREQPPPALRHACPECPEGLAMVFTKMTAKRAKDRHQSMTEVIADLETFVVHGALTGNGPLVGLTAYDQLARGAERIGDALALPPLPSLLDEAGLALPPHTADAPPTPFSMGLRAKAQRRLLVTIAAVLVTAVLTALLFGVVLRPPRLNDGMLIVEVNLPDCTVLVVDKQDRLEASRRGSGALSLLVEPGWHRVRVEKPGFKSAAQEFFVSPGQRLPLAIPLERESSPSSP